MTTTNKRRLESFVVAKLGQTTMPTSGTYYNSSTGVVSLNDGQLGVVSDSIWGTTAINTFTDATPTVAEAPVIKIMSGTSTSANPAASTTYPLWNRPFRATSSIDGRGTVTVTKQAYREPEHSVWLIGDAIGNAGAVNVLDETEYQIAVGLRGRRQVEAYSVEESAYLRAQYTSKNYTDLGLSTALAVDDILTNLSWQINRNSKAFSVNNRFPNKTPMVAMLIDSTGTTGTAIGGGSPIAAGDTITVVTQTSGTKTITLTEAMATSIKDAFVAYEGVAIASVVSTIMTTNLASAGSATGGTADMLMIMALDEDQVYLDYVEPVKVRLEVTIPSGFDYTTVRYSHDNKPDEGQGLYRILNNYWLKTQGQREYSLRHTEVPVISFPTPFVSGEKYVVYAFEHGNHQTVGNHTYNFNPFLDLVCIPAYSSGTTPNGLLSTFEGYINAWLGSTTHNDVIVSLS